MEKIKVNFNLDLRDKNSHLKSSLNVSKNDVNEIQLNAKNKLTIENSKLRKISTMRKATMKNLEEIGDVYLLDEKKFDLEESPKIDNQYKSKLRQDLTIIFGDEYNQQNIDDLPNENENLNENDDRKNKIKQDLTIIFGDEIQIDSDTKSLNNTN